DRKAQARALWSGFAGNALAARNAQALTTFPQAFTTHAELARKLGVSRKCLWERRQRLGIPRRKGVASET
ncbi:hypothetical protein QCD79_32800, partial [Pseudomonas quasicaspiana]|nr:hypothetical protein [Pseudomonas quasicaspiana]